MLDTITIKINDPSNPLDIGYLAECLLFYNKTNLLIDKDNLTQLFRRCGVDEIKELILRNYLSIFIKGNILGAGNRGDTFFVELFTVQNVDKHRETLYEAFYNLYGKQGKSRRNANRFVELTHSYKYDPSVLIQIRESIKENEFIRAIINSFFKDLGLEREFLGKKWSYDYIPIDDYNFKHDTTLNLKLLEGIAKKNNFHFDFSPSSLLLELSESLGDIQIAMNNNSEIFTTPISSKITSLKFENIFEKAKVNRENIDKFQRIVTPTYKNLASVINSGGKSFGELIELIEKAERFKAWKNEPNNESDLMEEYFRAIEKDTWLNKLPTKIGRFTLCELIGIATDILGAGGVGTVVATSWNVADAFLLDKILRKWKPNQFIKGDFTKFVK